MLACTQYIVWPTCLEQPLKSEHEYSTVKQSTFLQELESASESGMVGLYRIRMELENDTASGRIEHRLVKIGRVSA
jgi:hypothetical protein